MNSGNKLRILLTLLLSAVALIGFGQDIVEDSVWKEKLLIARVDFFATNVLKIGRELKMEVNGKEESQFETFGFGMIFNIKGSSTNTKFDTVSILTCHHILTSIMDLAQSESEEILKQNLRFKGLEPLTLPPNSNKIIEIKKDNSLDIAVIQILSSSFKGHVSFNDQKKHTFSFLLEHFPTIDSANIKNYKYQIFNPKNAFWGDRCIVTKAHKDSTYFYGQSSNVQGSFSGSPVISTEGVLGILAAEQGSRFRGISIIEIQKKIHEWGFEWGLKKPSAENFKSILDGYLIRAYQLLYKKPINSKAVACAETAYGAYCWIANRYPISVATLTTKLDSIKRLLSPQSPTSDFVSRLIRLKNSEKVDFRPFTNDLNIIYESNRSLFQNSRSNENRIPNNPEDKAHLLLDYLSISPNDSNVEKLNQTIDSLREMILNTPQFSSKDEVIMIEIQDYALGEYQLLSQCEIIQRVISLTKSIQDSFIINRVTITGIADGVPVREGKLVQQGESDSEISEKFGYFIKGVKVENPIQIHDNSVIRNLDIAFLRAKNLKTNLIKNKTLSDLAIDINAETTDLVGGEFRATVILFYVHKKNQVQLPEKNTTLSESPHHSIKIRFTTKTELIPVFEANQFDE